MTIRVLHVIGAMNRAGAETMLMNLYRTMDRERVQFDFVVHESHEGEYDAEIMDLGGKIYHLPRLTANNYFTYRAKCRDLMFKLAPEHPVVHGHIASTSSVYLAAAKQAGCKTVMHSHNTKFPLSVSEVAFRALAFPARHIADYFIACSPEAGLDRFGMSIVNSKQFSVLPNAIDTKEFSCTQRDHEECKRQLGYEGVTLIGNVGRLTRQKNQAFLLEVFSHMLHDGIHARLLIAGEGELRGDLGEQTRALGIEDKVDFLGVRDDIPRLLKALDLLVFPSIVEGLPVALVETQAAGLPCLASEAIPDMAVMSESMHRMPLDAGVDKWANRAEELLRAQFDRSAGAISVAAAGFDIAGNARWLTEFYENLACGSLPDANAIPSSRVS